MYKKKYFKKLLKLLDESHFKSHRLIVSDLYFELKIEFKNGEEVNWVYRQSELVSLTSVFFSVADTILKNK